jgi:hypothetical protein
MYRLLEDDPQRRKHVYDRCSICEANTECDVASDKPACVKQAQNRRFHRLQLHLTPTSRPTNVPTNAPTTGPTCRPTAVATTTPSQSPSGTPNSPSLVPNDQARNFPRGVQWMPLVLLLSSAQQGIIPKMV